MSDKGLNETKTGKLERADVISTLYWKVGYAQDIGSRSEQQDSVGAVLGTFHDKPALLAVLADGMGGMKNGAEFSRITVDFHLENFQRLLNSTDRLPFVLLAAAGGVVTWLWLRFVCRRVYGGYYYEGLISMYGMLTGTIGSGILLLREIDPDLRTPAANNLVIGSSFGIILGAPVLVLVGIASRSARMCFVTIGLALVYGVVLTLLICKAGRKKKNG